MRYHWNVGGDDLFGLLRLEFGVTECELEEIMSRRLVVDGGGVVVDVRCD